MTHKFSPPFEIYHAGIEIGDKEGHICTAENPEIALSILAALELHVTDPVSTVPPDRIRARSG